MQTLNFLGRHKWHEMPFDSITCTCSYNSDISPFFFNSQDSDEDISRSRGAVQCQWDNSEPGDGRQESMVADPTA